MNFCPVVYLLYRLLFPVLCLLVAPFWLIKMIQRGGWGSGLTERLGIYRRPASAERRGAVYLHAVSVGEILLALKLIERWREERPEDHFILVPTTATGMAVARERAGEDIRVIYAPLDFPWLIRRVMKRFAPRVVVLIESELWLALLRECKKLNIPVGVANARLSPRSERRLKKGRGVMAPFLSTLDRVGVPEESDRARWASLGVLLENVRHTGNVKFDPDGATLPQQRPDFAEMLAAFGSGRRVVMAVSTFAGEEEAIAEVILGMNGDLLPVIVPRHAERRQEVAEAITKHTGAPVVLRSRFAPPAEPDRSVFVVDSTGELRDWTAHADLVIVGKSFLSEKGGQNPAEAILAGVPVITGPHMANFEPLVSELRAAGGLRMVHDWSELAPAMEQLLTSSQDQTAAARQVLDRHEGAVSATIALFDSLSTSRSL